MESSTYDTPYGLITAVACLHWFDLNIALPRFRDLLRQPAICRLVLERVAVALLHTIRRVRIPEIQVHEPVVVTPIPVDTIQHGQTDFVRRLLAALPRVVDLVEADVEMPGAVPLGERADTDGVITGFTQLAHPRVLRIATLEGAVAALRERIGLNATVVDDTVDDPELAGEERRTRRQTVHVGAAAVGKPNALGGDAIDFRGGIAMVALAAEVIGALGVYVYIENAHSVT